MIVASWYRLTQAIARGVPCYTPIEGPPYGTADRCGDCDGCKDHGKIEEALAAVEVEFEQAIEEAAASQRGGM